MEGKILTAMSASSIRMLINAANSFNIKKEDIVSLLKEDNEFVLIYYGK